MSKQKDIYWHLPGFVYFRVLNQLFINLMRDFPDKFRDGYKIGSVYGTFPGAIWNGGRVVMGITPKQDIEKLLEMYNKLGIPVRFTWTNSVLTQQHTLDTYCNLIMRLADNGLNQVLVNTPVLENYIREHYPNFKLISSTTKRIVDPEQLLQELEKDYFLVVLDYDMNHDEKVLQRVEPYADRIEILVNEVCYPGCTKRTEHYKQQSELQLEYDPYTAFQCPNVSRPRTFAECMERPAFIRNEQIGDYIDKGFVNFKIAGRGMPLDYVKDSYLYFLVKDEYQEEMRKQVDFMLKRMQNPNAGK